MSETVEQLLNRLQDTVEQARALPMSASCVVHRADVLDLVAAVRQALPAQLDDAQGVVEHAEQVMDAARRQGELELARAREQAEAMLSQQAVVAAAQSRAAKLLADAEAEAARLLAEADDYCDRRLADFEIDLARIAQQVRKGRDKLRERAATGEGAGDDAGEGGADDQPDEGLGVRTALG